MHDATRRTFLGTIGHGMLLTCVGPSLASGLGASSVPDLARRKRRLPSDLERLVRTMQDTAPDELMQKLAAELAAGTTLQTLVAAGSLANARTFGGEDYEGYHAQMALLPALHMAQRTSGKLRPLPVLKVLYRNSARIQRSGGGRERLQPIAADSVGDDARSQLLQHMRAGSMEPAERLFSGMCKANVATAYDDLQALVRDDLNVHRITLAWRAFDMLPLVGAEHAHTMLRQCVRFCVDEEQHRIRKGEREPAVRSDLPKLLDQHRLLGRAPGSRRPDDAAIEELATIVFRESRARAADAVAAALAEGFEADAVAEAICLAANRLLLHDTGANRVHGASVGVHACDAANAWRNVARTGPHASRIANLIVAAYHTAGQSERVGKEPFASGERTQGSTAAPAAPDELLQTLRTAIERCDQRAACVAAQSYGEADMPAEPIFQLLLGYAVAQDGALHAEKYYHTAHEEFARSRAAWRWHHVVALARVIASGQVEPAPGHTLTRRLLEA